MLGERFLLNQHIRSIPLRICVTGTRGKSSVVRLIASSLREAGFTVLARTTGSRPVIILPDGEEKEVKRRGSPSILEGKKILREGAKLRVQALVLELMSIQPECGYSESVQMFKPHILVITNVRLDHLAQMGSSKEDIACSFASSVPESCTVFLPQEEFFPVFREVAEKLSSEIIQISSDSYAEYLKSKKKLPTLEFEENIRFSLAVAEFVGIDKKVAIRGVLKAHPDFGGLKVWIADIGSPPRSLYLVSLFAANDPQSTRLVLSRLDERKFFERKKMIGLLNLRRDRGDRTLQWLKALKEGTFSRFQKIFFIGDHARALKSKLELSAKAELFIIKPQSPQKIMEEISEMEKEEAVLVGMGNMGGAGKELVRYWEKIGKSYDF